MDKKHYEKPSTQVVEVQQTQMVMTSPTGVTSTRSNYGTAVEQEWN